MGITFRQTLTITSPEENIDIGVSPTDIASMATQESIAQSTGPNENMNKWLLHHNSSSISCQHPPVPYRTDLKLLIASSSIAKGINVDRFNECFGSGTARIQKWPGGRARHMKNYITTHLEEENPDVIIVQAVGNDLAERKNRAPIDQIAKDVVEIALKAKNNGVKDIFVAGVPVRRNQFSNDDLYKLNQAISTLCHQHNFVFIDNAKIEVSHLYDGVHLNDAGITILADNYLGALRVKYRGYITR